MADTYVAVSEVRFGAEDGTVTVFAPGEKVAKSKFSDSEWEGLVEAGAVAKSGEAPEEAPAKTQTSAEVQQAHSDRAVAQSKAKAEE